MSCPNPLHAEDCPCDNDVADEPTCEGMVHVAGRLVDCGSTDDIVPWTDAHGLDHMLCVACTATAKEEEERERDADFDRMLMAIPPEQDFRLRGNGAGQESGSSVSTHAQVLTSGNAMPGKGVNPGPFSPSEEATPEPVLDEELTEKIPEETMAELVVNGGK